MSLTYKPPKNRRDPNLGGILTLSVNVDVDPNNEFLRFVEGSQGVLELIGQIIVENMMSIGQTQDAQIGRLKMLIFLAGLINVSKELDQISDPGARIDFSAS